MTAAAAASRLLDGKCVIVTGAESGIGRGIALGCAEAGASVLVAGLAESGLTAVAGQIATAGGRAVPMVVDIRRPDRVHAMFEACAERFGRIDGIVANAGVLGDRAAAADLTLEAWESILAVNLTGTFLTVQEAARRLLAQGGGGSILAVGSSTALRPGLGFLAYTASKGGIHAMMQALALELAPHRIRVNTLIPAPPTPRAPGHGPDTSRGSPAACRWAKW